MTIEVEHQRRPSSCGVGGTGAALPPGFRFHPTDEELILHYLRKRAAAAPCPAAIIAEVDIYKFDPWDLPAMAVFGEAEWYFFSPRDRKYPNGVRPNRAARSGYWKATGTDKPITLSTAGDDDMLLGVKKALVFYRGRPPKGAKTSWIMHEYRLADSLAATANNYKHAASHSNKKASSSSSSSSSSMRLDDWVLCRIYKKTNTQSLHLSPSMDDDDGVGQLPQGEDSIAAVDDVVTSSRAHYDAPATMFRMPKPPSISDFLVDYSAVSELFDNLPAESSQLNLGLATTGGAGAGSGSQFFVAGDEGSMRNNKRQVEDDYCTDQTTSTFHAYSSSKRQAYS